MKYMKNTGKCSVATCTRLSRSLGFCNNHYKRFKKRGDPNVVLIEKNKGKVCKVEGCSSPAFSKLYCSVHYDSVFKHGREFLVLGKRGSGYITKDGYREYTIAGEKKLEHVLVAERALGGPLPPGAVVHHMNEDKLDNFTPFNLILCPDQAYHMLLHKRMREWKVSHAQDSPEKLGL